MDKAMERLRWGQILEDCGLAIQDLYNSGRAQDAMVVRLVVSHHLVDLISILMAKRPAGRTDAVEVVKAASSIMQRENRKADLEVPLVSLGQGDYRRDYHEQDFVKVEAPKTRRSSWLRRAALRMLGVVA